VKGGEKASAGSNAASDSESDSELSALNDVGGEDDRTDVAGGVVLRAAIAVSAGTVLGDRYQIEAALGEGGSGTVYRAWDRMLGEAVAIKILHPQRARERSWIKRLAREVKVARVIGHPNVCRVFELGHADGHWFVTMELATGGSLRDMLRGGVPAGPPSVQPPGGGGDAASRGQAASRPLEDRLRDMRELCAGLAAMHAVAITHRDVTPQNVLRMADGRLVLTDFGLAIEQNDEWLVGHRYLSAHSLEAILTDINKDNNTEEARELTTA
jgi:serine/threonine protein kinase